MPKIVTLSGFCFVLIVLLAIAGPAVAGPVASQEPMMDNSALRDHVNNGNQLMMRGQFAAALSEYEAAKTLEPSNSVVKRNIAEVHNNWGVSYFKQKHYSDAISHFQKCLANYPGHRNAQYNMMLCRRAMEREGINPDESPADSEEKAETAKKDDAGKKEKAETPATAPAGTAAPSSPADPMSVSYGSKTLFNNAQPTSTQFASGSAMFPVYSDKKSAVSTPVTVVNPAAMPSPKPPASQTPADAASAQQQEASKSPAAAPNAPATPTTAAASAGTSTETNASNAAGQSVAAAAASAAPVKPIFTQATSAGSGGYSTIQPSYENVDHYSYKQGSAASPDVEGALMSLDEKVAALELKVYGKKHADWPIMRRIENLETDYIGQTRSGSMNERVEFLKRQIGQN